MFSFSLPPGKCCDGTSACMSLLPGPLFEEGMTAFCCLYFCVNFAFVFHMIKTGNST